MMMDIDDILITDPKTRQETLRERLDKMDDRIDLALMLGVSVLAVLLLVASSKGS